ncbi:hypothetical protein PS880_01032 [Pseudomonas fluorescens]|uniref:Uncharacterized protein n=1 Tax=Pseudomonas fluorescens TaxID=294 RepID=A0A5E7I093_PSEFL|nr:hypothetical protein PS880_01032 [Pseudomonas fluorescens]
MPPVTLCVTFEEDAERPGLHSHAERGSDQRTLDACMDMSIPDSAGFSPSGILRIVFLFPPRAPIMVAFFAQ